MFGMWIIQLLMKVPTILFKARNQNQQTSHININQQIIKYQLYHRMIGVQEQKYFTVKDIPSAEFIRAYADFLKKNNKLERPAWVDYVKTNNGKELAPLDDDWLYIRVASLARKIYIRPRTGVQLLSHIYGSKKQKALGRPHHQSASGKIIRWGLQQLQKLKVIKKDKKTDDLKVNSRVISKEGVKDLNRIATEVALGKRKVVA